MKPFRGLFYFIYLDIVLLISFERVEAYNFAVSYKKIMDSIRPTNVEYNAGRRMKQDFKWFFEEDFDKTLTKLNSAWNFVRKLYRFFYETVNKCFFYLKKFVQLLMVVSLYRH